MSGPDIHAIANAVEIWLAKAVETPDVRRARLLLERAKEGLQTLARVEPRPVQTVAYLEQSVARCAAKCRDMGFM